MKKLITVLCLIAIAAGLFGCTGALAQSDVPEVTGTVTYDAKYGAAVTDLSQEDFTDAGFALGDSCNITFSNGYSLEEVPYFNGYYVQNGEPIVVAYPGFDTVRITLNNEGIWEEAGLEEGDTVTIRLHTAGDYISVQEVLGQVYSDMPEDYDSDVRFCNFRALTGGNIAANFLYRGASPFDDGHGRADRTGALMGLVGIEFILDLADSQDDMTEYLDNGNNTSPYAVSLYEDGNIALLDMSSSYGSEAYQQALVTGLREMMLSTGPVYIHCTEGKDRTGFVCCLLEALAGASYKEMRNDYMTTYENYYGITRNGTPLKYSDIVELYFDPIAAYLLGIDSDDTAALAAADYTEAAAAYLRDGGMTDAEIAALQAYICE